MCFQYCKTCFDDSCFNTFLNIPGLTRYRHDNSQCRGDGACIFVRSRISKYVFTYNFTYHEFNLWKSVFYKRQCNAPCMSYLQPAILIFRL